MKKYKKNIVKILSMLIFIFCITIVLKTTYAYQIVNKVVKKEHLSPVIAENGVPKDNVPDYIYSKQTAAYADTIRAYSLIGKYGRYKSPSGWIYMDDLQNANVAGPDEDIFRDVSSYVHTNNRSFVRVQEYFHQYQNSLYATDPGNTGGYQARYYSSGTIWPGQPSPLVYNLTKSTVYNVWGESGSYQGVYSAPLNTNNSIATYIGSANEKIYIKPNNLYRFAVKDGVFVSDNYLTENEINQLWKKFGTENNSAELLVYQSSVLRTAQSNAKNGEIYYHNMDTSYKFWETTIRGSRTARGLWDQSTSTTGGWNGAYSVINYYDNIFVLPKGKEITVYVRHIDASGLATINPANISDDRVFEINNGQVIQCTQEDWEIPLSDENDRYIDPSNRNISINGEKYTEQYNKPISKNVWRIGNVKYEYGTGDNYMSYLNPDARNNLPGFTLSNTEKDILNEYSCIGAVVGKGSSIEEAVESRNKSLNNVDLRTAASGSNEQGAIVKSGDYSSVIIPGNEPQNVIVIDFYYEKPTNPDTTVYVRHIDVTDAQNITSDSIGKLIQDGNVLPGKGEAKLSNGKLIQKNSYTRSGYQETYTVSNSTSLEIFRDPSEEEYTCIGSNVVSNGTNSIASARESMNNKLDSNVKYDTNYTNSRIVNTGTKDVVLVDFYYVNKQEPINQPTKVGRLSYYTHEENSEFASTVNGKTQDIIPSGETLRMSIDNAYTYMLGGINVKEQNVQNTYKFTYTLTQPYIAYKKDWTSTCNSCGETYNDVRTASCTNQVEAGQNCTTSESGNKTCTTIYKSCGSISYDTSFEWEEVTGSVSKDFTYNIPCSYTFYKVSNMRMYTIDKIELLDGYTNSGLALFDGKTYTMNTVSKYDQSFKDATFNISSNSEKLTRTSKNLTSLTYYLDNETDIEDGEARSDVREKINNNLFAKINNNIAAAMKGFKASSKDEPRNHSYTGYNEAEEPLKAEFYIKNDEISFKDNVSNKNITIIGIDAKTGAGTSYERSEKEAKKIVDLSEYKKDTKIEVETKYPETIKTNYEPSTKTTKEYFENIGLTIPKLRVNGRRYSYGKIYYNLLTGNNVLNFDSAQPTNITSENCHSWNNSSNRTAVSGNVGNNFLDNVKKESEGKTVSVSKLTLLNNIIWDYGKANNQSEDADEVNVFTPVAFETSVVQKNDANTNDIVDHTTEDTTTTYQIQKNSEFTIKINSKVNSTYQGVNTKKYIDHYYIKFDFDVQNIKIYDARGGNSGRNYSTVSVSKGEWIGPIYNKASTGEVTVKAFALADPNEAVGVVNQESNEYEVRAVAYNAPSSLVYDVSRGRSLDNNFITATQNSFTGLESKNTTHQDYYEQKNIVGHSNYVSETTVATENISRVYDFKVTDLKDIDWKNIFRASTSTTTNVHSSKAYYSGIKKWNIYTTNYNDLVIRDVSEIGATKQQILPLGPYKNTNTTYTKAPKLGYRFSFDLKTTGANDNKKIIIEPSFYYISKDGKDYKSNVKLFYKNTNNKYVSIDNYKLYFVPNDGYRLTFEGTDEAYRFDESTMKKSTVTLGTATGLTLTKDMQEKADNMFVQIWYGEYKLPNSTIIVETDSEGKNYDINKKLTNGYIGVKFDIKVEEYSTAGIKKRTLSYSRNNNNSTGTNTSQWDYEGYLGFENPGSAASNLRIVLEKGVWTINDDMYNKIKGTVILYDTDTKASSDYN